MDENSYLYFGIILFLIFIVSIQTYSIMTRNMPKITIENQIQDDSKPNDEVRLWLLLSKRYAENHEYSRCEENRSCFNCVGYSSGLYNISKELGFKVEMVKGCSIYNSSECHRWNRVSFDVEPQTGQFVNYDHEYTDIEVIK